MATRTWNIDTSHSNVGFTVRHMMMLKVHGRFGKWEGTITLDDADPTKSSVAVSIDVASVDTNEPKRDGHLRSPDFFDTEAFPKLTFASKRVKDLGGCKLEVVGDLSLHGVTKEVVLRAEQVGKGKDPWGNERVAFEATTSFSRSDFGLKWNQALETGGVLVSDKVEVTLEVQAIPAAAANAA
jgi:polyisoprenoid-binding protein YceI